MAPKSLTTFSDVYDAGATGRVPTVPTVIIDAVLSREVYYEVSLKQTPVTQHVPVSIMHSLAIAVVVFSAPVTPTGDIPGPAVRVEGHAPVVELSVVRGVTSTFEDVATYLSSKTV